MEFAVNIPTGCGASQYSNLPNCGDISWEKQRGFGVAMEELGFDGLAVPDHLMTDEGGVTECLTTVTALAGVTDSVYLYPKTINNPLRHAPLLAKYAATIDNISGGRLKLGMGAGWKADEAVAFGYDWADAPTRLRELEESIELLKRLFTEEEVTYDGEFYSVEDATNRPFPVQEPRPPIMVGGGGEQFTLRIAAKHADCWNYWGSLDLMLGKLDVLRTHCETYDRDPDEIQKSWFARCVIRETREEVDALLEEVPQFAPENLDDTEHHLVGTPSQIAADIERFAAHGFDEVVVEFVDFPETTGAELFADEVLPQF